VAELETSIVTAVFLPLALAIFMFGMGLATPARAFGQATKQPRGLILGLVGQLVALPLLALLVVVVFFPFGLERDIALGILLLGALPGGATSNVLAHLSRGDTALSIVLTAITSFTAVLWTPLILLVSTRLLMGDGVLVSIEFVEIAQLVVGIIAIPVLAGIFVAKRWPNFAAAADRPFRVGAIIFLALLVGAAIAQNREGFWNKAALSVPAALVLNLLAMGAGWILGSWTNGAQRRTIVIEVGFQNGTFGIVLATTQLDSAAAALVPAFYSLVMFATGALLAARWSRMPPRNVGTTRVRRVVDG
jgi:bile acid:Na+ symporter, BASS family